MSVQQKLLLSGQSVAATLPFNCFFIFSVFTRWITRAHTGVNLHCICNVCNSLGCHHTECSQEVFTRCHPVYHVVVTQLSLHLFTEWSLSVVVTQLSLHLFTEWSLSVVVTQLSLHWVITECNGHSVVTVIIHWVITECGSHSVVTAGINSVVTECGGHSVVTVFYLLGIISLGDNWVKFWVVTQW
jgi:hypothetical protein